MIECHLERRNKVLNCTQFIMVEIANVNFIILTHCDNLEELSSLEC